MASDTALERYSAMNISCPWRGLNVVPNATIPAGERIAVMFLYAFGSGPPGGGDDSNRVRVGMVRSAYVSDNPSIGGQF